MTTAAKLRDTILRCAREAIQAEPTCVDDRLHSFIAKMSGAMEVIGERELDESLWSLLQAPAKPAQSHDLAAWRNQKLFTLSSSASEPGSKLLSQDQEASSSKSAPAPGGQ